MKRNFSIIILLIILFTLLPSFTILPVSSENDKKYYVYKIATETREDGEQLRDRVVFKLVEVNETAYKVVLVEANESSLLGRGFRNGVIEYLENMTNGIVGIDKNKKWRFLRLPDPASYVFWLSPDLLEKARKAADMVNNERVKVCDLMRRN